MRRYGKATLRLVVFCLLGSILVMARPGAANAIKWLSAGSGIGGELSFLWAGDSTTTSLSRHSSPGNTNAHDLTQDRYVLSGLSSGVEYTITACEHLDGVPVQGSERTYNAGETPTIVATVTDKDAKTGHCSPLALLPCGAVSMVLCEDIAEPTVNGGPGVLPQGMPIDLYGNLCGDDDSTEIIASRIDAGTWRLGGTLGVTASGGVATFEDLLAYNTGAVVGARRVFGSGGLAQATSNSVNTAAQRLDLLLPYGIQAGCPFDATVLALTADGDIDTGFTKEVFFSWGGTLAATSSDPVFTVDDGGQKTISVTFPSASPQALLVSEVPDASLLGYWRFDEGAGDVLCDSSSYGRTGTIVRATGWVDGVPGTYFANPSGLQFDGNSGYAQVEPAPDLSNRSFSIAFWAKRDRTDPSSNEWVIGQGDVGEDMGLHIGFRSNGQFSFAFFSDDLNIPAEDYVNDTQWHHWLVTYDADTRTQQVYQDGVPCGSRIANGHYNNTGVMYIGVRFDTGYFGGSLDDLQIYGRVLAEDEIGRLSAGGAALVCGQALPEYEVTLPVGPGFAATLETGSAAIVNYNGECSFRVTLLPGYSDSVITVRSNGVLQTPVEGVYTLEEITQNQSVTVEGVTPNLLGIEITCPPTKASYYTGETLDLTGLVVTGTYGDGSTTVLPIEAENLTGFSSGKPEDGQIVTVSWEGKTATFNVDILVPPGTFAGGKGSSTDPYLIQTSVHLNNIRLYPDAHYLQTADIDLTGISWEPVGNYATPFTGHYDGGHHTLGGLGIGKPGVSEVGLFGFVSGGATVKRTHVTSANVTGGVNVGILVGIIADGGGAQGGGIVEDCSSTGTVTGTARVGGLVGGVQQGGAVVRRSYSTATVSANPGGSQNGSAGGFAGFLLSGLIENCYSAGRVTAGRYVCGFIGEAQGGTVRRCYAATSVNGTMPKGFVINTSSVTYCFFNYDIGPWDDFATKKTTSEMKTKATFTAAGWDFTADTGVWRIVDGFTYPILGWELISADERIITDWLSLGWDAIKGENSAEDNVTMDLVLPGSGASGTDITWEAHPGTCINTTTGIIVPSTTQDIEARLTGTVSYVGGAPRSKEFNLLILQKPIALAHITTVDDISVAYGTQEAAAIAALPCTTTIADNYGETYTVTLVWMIADYDGTEAGDYAATGTFALPEGVNQTDPQTPLQVSAVVTVSPYVPSDNADLGGLTLGGQELDPAFDPKVTSYTVSVHSGVSSTDVTPVLADTKATMTVNGGPAASGVAIPIAVNVGSNTVTILVTAEDKTTKTYTILVNRAASPPETYAVTYNPNGGFGAAPTEKDKAAGDTFRAAPSNSFMAPANHRFKEWNTSGDGEGESVAAGATVAMPPVPLTLYAIWEAAPEMNSYLRVTTLAGGIVRLGGSAEPLVDTYSVEHPMDMDVRLEAIPSDGYTFAYWATTDTDRIISTNPVYRCVLGAGVSVKAVYSKIPTAEDTFFAVTFKDKSGRILKSYGVSKGEDAVPPSEPAILGYVFRDWSPAYTDIASDLLTTAVYERLPGTYIVTVRSGTLSTGETQGTYQFDMAVTVLADAAPEGKQFSHWTLDDMRVSTKSTFSFFAPMRDVTLQAVFADEGTVLNDVPFVTLSDHVMMDEENGTMMFTAIKNVPIGYAPAECGVLLAKGPLADDLTLDTPGVLLLKITNFANDQFYARKVNVASGDTWYARAYLIYQDTNGNTVTVYSDQTVNRTMEGE